jgi:DNA-binding NarL/FixJ family response regulator
MKNITLLLADDHDLFRQGLSSLLLSSPHLEILAQVDDGNKALQGIKLHQPDVALLDMTMPGMTGMQVCRELQQLNLPTKVVILTMHDDLLLAQEIMQSGASGFVLKDNTFEEVIDAINCANRGEIYISPSISERLAQSEDKISPLSARELDVLRMLAEGMTVKYIAAQLGVSTKSVDTYRQRLLNKLGATNSAQLIQYAVRRSLI